ncbi:MAG: FHA domain-containing protein, partial [bacterium]|nr:FHA domain-containing protein [bacterium]
PEVKAKTFTSTSIFSSVLIQNLIAGLIGGFLAWVVTEVFYDDYRRTTSMIEMLVEMGFLGGCMGALIGVCLGAVEGITSRVGEKAVQGGLIGLGIGFAGGMIGGVFGQIIYSFFGGGSGRLGFVEQIMIRAIAWGLIGLFVGLAQGVAIRSKKKIVNGLLGGLIGGTVGGGLFDIVGSLVESGELSRAITITLLGTCTGVGIGIVEELRKEAWLKVVQGWTKGKEYIIYNEVTTIGSSPKCDIVLFKDPSIIPKHAMIKIENNRYILYDLQSQTGTFVNQQPISRKVLANGNIIQIGNTVMVHYERAIAKSFPPI